MPISYGCLIFLSLARFCPRVRWCLSSIWSPEDSVLLFVFFFCTLCEMSWNIAYSVVRKTWFLPTSAQIWLDLAGFALSFHVSGRSHVRLHHHLTLSSFIGESWRYAPSDNSWNLFQHVCLVLMTKLFGFDHRLVIPTQDGASRGELVSQPRANCKPDLSLFQHNKTICFLCI